MINVTISVQDNYNIKKTSIIGPETNLYKLLLRHPKFPNL